MQPQRTYKQWANPKVRSVPTEPNRYGKAQNERHGCREIADDDGARLNCLLISHDLNHDLTKCIRHVDTRFSISNFERSVLRCIDADLSNRMQPITNSKADDEIYQFHERAREAPGYAKQTPPFFSLLFNCVETSPKPDKLDEQIN